MNESSLNRKQLCATCGGSGWFTRFGVYGTSNILEEFHFRCIWCSGTGYRGTK